MKFGDDPLGIHQPHLHATDTSLKMNQLATKYLHAPVPAPREAPKTNIDMSFATKNYMERHKLMQGLLLIKKYGLTTVMMSTVVILSDPLRCLRGSQSIVSS